MKILHYNIDMTPESEWEIVSAGQFARNHLLYLQEAGDFDSGKNYYTLREGLDSFLIKLTLSGQGILEYAGESWTLTPGTFFWIDCRNPQRYYTDPETGSWHVLWIHFCGVTADAYYQAFLSASGGKPVAFADTDSTGRNSSISEQMYSLLHQCSAGPGDDRQDIRISSLLTALLAGLIEQAGQNVPKKRIPESIRDIQKYLQQHYSEHITLDHLAGQFCISKYHLLRLMKKYLGHSPSDYLNLLRMTQARQLLRATDLPISEIAYRVGIENTSYFVSQFRKYEGITPARYRRQWSGTPLS